MPLSYLEVDLFPSINEDVSIYKFYDFLEKLSNDSIYVEFWISIVGVFLTIFHLVVLSKITGSSIVSIMIGVAICDLLSMIVNIASRDMILNFFGAACTPPNTLFINHVFWILMTIRDDVIRCSTWLTVLMALIRYLVSKYFSKTQFHVMSGFHFGFLASLVSFLISSLFSMFFYLCVKFVEVGKWKPSQNCTNIPLHTEMLLYEQRLSDMFSIDNGTPLRIFQLVNGSASKIIPCILLPFLTTLLAVELRRTEKNRRSTSVLYKNNTEKTTILVIIMTFLIFVASLPTGIATAFQVAYVDLGFLFIFIYVDTICNALLLSTASINCFICFAMSSQYRKTAKRMLRNAILNEWMACPGNINGEEINANSLFLSRDPINKDI
ncbi:CRE-SRW-91 protein [Caenorhabditis remanei]|uniref:CRE-SRW-91 protein n=1 Tax=Caenorhabditis remanei TaxID=31234 RepID=E3LLF6_CAERE|nr:CRE-SRW-91 protein [Caenorhabditis remanei]